MKVDNLHACSVARYRGCLGYRPLQLPLRKLEPLDLHCHNPAIVTRSRVSSLPASGRHCLAGLQMKSGFPTMSKPMLLLEQQKTKGGGDVTTRCAWTEKNWRSIQSGRRETETHSFGRHI
ncbi:hypothetical protein [Bradyrhizobium liaoningense]|uniref:hypothetical protein n=1 Tax=Bradyrhizobium liaoningense TaxID=43992 RepID=UPI001BA6A57C|nr:hypothetical protein [Bradyrhizobium liaoningense]MBR0859220.1 hypothetical protein [Bradyrhizobium liaoningense]